MMRWQPALQFVRAPLLNRQSTYMRKQQNRITSFCSTYVAFSAVDLMNRCAHNYNLFVDTLVLIEAQATNWPLSVQSNEDGNRKRQCKALKRKWNRLIVVFTRTTRYGECQLNPRGLILRMQKQNEICCRFKIHLVLGAKKLERQTHAMRSAHSIDRQAICYTTLNWLRFSGSVKSTYPSVGRMETIFLPCFSPITIQPRLRIIDKIAA